MSLDGSERNLAERDLSQIDELRRLVNAGRQVPLLGSTIYIVWGFTVAVTAGTHLALLFIGTTPAALLVLWTVALAACVAAIAVSMRRIEEDRRASIARNRASGLLWIIGGAAIMLFYAASFVRHPEAVALTPAVAAFIFAVIVTAVGVAAPLPLVRFQVIGWLLFGTLYLLLDDVRFKVAGLQVAAVLLLILPGVALRRAERAPTR